MTQPIKRFDGTSKFTPCPKPERTVKPKKGLSKVRKTTGEAEVFKRIASKRKHVSFVSGAKIVQLTVSNFAHVLRKGNYPHYRLEEKNIVLLTASEHDLFDNARHVIRDHPEWQKLFRLEEKLKAEYNSKHR